MCALTPNTAANPPLQVAVGVLRCPQGTVLVAKRDNARHQGGLWEFPGGKVEPGESSVDALRRELTEELGITAQSFHPLIQIPYDYGDRRVVLDVHCVTTWQGEPQGLEGQPLRWLTPWAMQDAAFPAANRPIIRALRAPEQYVISPDVDDPSAWWAGFDGVLAAGQRLIQLRVRGTQAERLALAAAVMTRLQAVNAARPAKDQVRLLINRDIALAQAVGAHGVHCNAQQLNALTKRPVPMDQWFGVSCHSPDELAQAAHIQADFAVYGPVQTTASHPQARPIGWMAFASAIRAAPLPVYALGGMQPSDCAQAQALGGQGVAGIRGFWG